MIDPEPSSIPPAPDPGSQSGRALRGGALRSGGYAAGLVVSLASVPLVVRHLGVADYGLYVTAGAIVAVVLGLTEGGLNAVTIREYATRDRAGQDVLMRDALGVRLLVTSAGVLGAVAFTAVAGYGGRVTAGVALAGVGLVLQLMQSILAVPLQARLMLGRTALVDFGAQVLKVVLIVVLVLAGRGLVALLAVAIPASALSLALTAALARRWTPLVPSFDRRRAWALLRDSVPFAAAIAVNVVYLRMAMILTSLIASPAQTGYFATAFRVIEVLVAVPALAVGAAFPLLARAEHGDRERFVTASVRLFELAVLVGAYVSAVVLVGAPLAIAVLAGDDGQPSEAVLRIEAIGIVATFANAACTYPLLSLRRYRELLVASLVALLSSVVLVSLLVGPFGARGSAVAAVLGEVGLALVTAWLLVRSERRLVLRLRVVALAVGAAGVAGTAGILLPVPAAGQVLVTAGIYPALLAAAGQLPPELRQLVRVPRRRRDPAEQPAMS